jgi:hypothetical protein
MSKLLGPSGLPINALASEVRNRILEQPGDENLPNLVGAPGAQLEIDRRADGSFRLGVQDSKQRCDVVMNRDTLALFIAECIRVGQFR